MNLNTKLLMSYQHDRALQQTWDAMCSTTPLLWCYSAARLQSYVICYFCTSLVYYIIQNVLVNKKIEKIKLHLCLFIDFEVHLGWGMPCQDQGVVPWDYTLLAGQQSQKNVFGGTTTGWQGSSPIFLMLIGLFVSHDQNNKDGRHFRKTTHLADKSNHFASL